MKKLYIVRHAKSEWENFIEIEDIDRPLNTRGVLNAYEMSARLKDKNILPDAIISSNGIRALHTAVIFAHEIGFDTEKIKIIPDLYHSSAAEMLRQIKRTDESIGVLMLFAHNPGISEFASFVNKERYIDIATCGILEVNVRADTWAHADFPNLDWKTYDSPKNKK